MICRLVRKIRMWYALRLINRWAEDTLLESLVKAEKAEERRLRLKADYVVIASNDKWPEDNASYPRFYLRSRYMEGHIPVKAEKFEQC